MKNANSIAPTSPASGTVSQNSVVGPTSVQDKPSKELGLNSQTQSQDVRSTAAPPTTQEIDKHTTTQLLTKPEKLAEPILPPVRLPSSTTSSHPSSSFPHVANQSTAVTDVADTTEKDSSFSTALAQKINSMDPTLRPESVVITKEKSALTTEASDDTKTTSSVSKSESKNSSEKRPKNSSVKSKLKFIVGGLVLLLIVGGSAVGYYLQQQSQDTRKDAASEEVTGTEMARTPEEWQTFNQNWLTFMADPGHTWQDYVAYSQAEGARYRCQSPIMQVGKETLYGCDLNALFILKDSETYIRPEPIPPQSAELNAVLDSVITDSALLQKAADMNVLKLTNELFNSPEKNTIARFSAVKQSRELLAEQFVKKVDFETIAIYFRNEIDPTIPLEDAKVAAKAKMDNLYARLNAGDITMEEAGIEIAADSIKGDTTGVSLKQLDPRGIYPHNAYFIGLGYDFNGTYFKDAVYDDELRSLGEGQMSTVRVCKDYVFTPEQFAQAKGDVSGFPFEDSCYIIFKVNKIHIAPMSSEYVSGDQKEMEEKIKASVETRNMLQ